MNHYGIGDYWKCKNCGYIVSDIEYNSIRFEPECSCGEKWSMFTFVKEETLKPPTERKELK